MAEQFFLTIWDCCQSWWKFLLLWFFFWYVCVSLALVCETIHVEIQDWLNEYRLMRMGSREIKDPDPEIFEDYFKTIYPKK